MFPTRYKSTARFKKIPEKFRRVPTDEDTRIISEKCILIKQYEVLHQKWAWEAVKAESIIYVSADIDHLQDEQLIKLVEESELVINSNSFTISKTDSEYTFVNFNFEAD